jgi:hypothetical protein
MSRCIRATTRDWEEEHIRIRRAQKHASDADLLHPVRHYARNPRGRDFVVGDIHGCLSKLDAELPRVRSTRHAIACSAWGI